MNSVKNYQTKQKVIILDLLQRNQSVHLTVEQMLNILKEEETPVGKTTLYRFLETMIDSGEVQKFNLDNITSCYQYVGTDKVHNHYHLKCNICGKITHVDDPCINRMNNKIEKNCDFKIDQSRTVFYGICKECQENKYDKENYK